jgi:hypothetical protein
MDHAHRRFCWQVFDKWRLWSLSQYRTSQASAVTFAQFQLTFEPSEGSCWLLLYYTSHQPTLVSVDLHSAPEEVEGPRRCMHCRYGPLRSRVIQTHISSLAKQPTTISTRSCGQKKASKCLRFTCHKTLQTASRAGDQPRDGGQPSRQSKHRDVARNASEGARGYHGFSSCTSSVGKGTDGQVTRSSGKACRVVTYRYQLRVKLSRGVCNHFINSPMQKWTKRAHVAFFAPPLYHSPTPREMRRQC